MPFLTRMQQGIFAVALEITPPQKTLPGVLLRRARLLNDYVQAINVIQRPGRQSSLDASIALREAGLNPAWHLVNRGRTRAELLADLARAHAAGIRQVLCIRGDHRGGDTPDTPLLKELVAMARDAMPGAAIGATLNQYAPDRAAVLRNLLPKLKAGARYVQTQPVFGFERFRESAEQLRERSPETKIVAMAMPLLASDNAGRIGERLGITLPEAEERRIAAGAGEAWSLFDETLASLAGSPFADGVAIMTFEMDPPREMGARIIEALRRAGIAEVAAPPAQA